MALDTTQVANADEIVKLARGAGLSDIQAYEMAGAAYQESGLSESSRNSSSGAFGLFQLLSPGYVSSYNANVAKGESPVDANINAILPNYVSTFKMYPTAAPGTVAAKVEASGEPASWYAGGIATVLNDPAFRSSENITGSTAAAEGLAPIPGTGLYQPPGGGTTVPTHGGNLIPSGIPNPISGVTDALKFLFSYRFLEILGGGALVLVGIIALAKDANIAVPAPAPAKKAAGAIA